MNDYLYNDALMALVSSLSAEQSLRNAFSVLKRFFSADGAFINVFNKQKREIVFVAHCGTGSGDQALAPIAVPPGYAVAQYEGAVRILDDIEEDSFTAYVLEQRIPQVRSLMMMSLDQDGQHLGVVCFYSRFLSSFRKEEADFLSRLHDAFCLVTSNSLRMILARDNDVLSSENHTLRDAEVRGRQDRINNFLGQTPDLREVGRLAEQVSKTDIPVLILGETGSGKEVIADLVQNLSDRKNAPFIKINCGAIPETLIDAEFFGYEKGSFTDAKHAKAGIFEQADGGTLFLDEVGELSPSSQVRLLRVLQQKVVRRIGSEKETQVDFRLIAATHRDLFKMADEGTFRSDLLYRLDLFPLRIPPLRERKADIGPLSELFLQRFKRKYNIREAVGLSAESQRAMLEYPWPGNVRELENTLERAFLIAEDRSCIEVSFRRHAPAMPYTSVPGELLAAEKSKFPTFEDFQKGYFTRVLQVCGGKISGVGSAAELTGIHPNTLRSRLEKLGIPYRH